MTKQISSTLIQDNAKWGNHDQMFDVFLLVTVNLKMDFRAVRLQKHNLVQLASFVQPIPLVLRIKGWKVKVEGSSQFDFVMIENFQSTLFHF